MRELNHPKVKPLTPDIAAGLGFDPGFVGFLFAKSRPGCFDFWVESTDHSWTCHVPDNVEAAYPLWSTNADETLVCVGQSHLWFVHGYHDEPDTDHIANTVQGLLADLFMSLYEAAVSVEALREGARSCGFRHLDAVVSFEEGCGDDLTNWENGRTRLIEEIDAKSA